MAGEVLEDERAVELSAIKAIYPELEFGFERPFYAALEIPVMPISPLNVYFNQPLVGTVAAENREISSKASQENSRGLQNIQTRPMDCSINIQKLAHLPSLMLEIFLPDGYPEFQRPTFKLSADPSWLPQHIIGRLELDGTNIWEEYGHTQIVFSYIDHLLQAAESGFGFGNQPLELSHDLRLPLLAFDEDSKRDKFDRQTFHCGVCLEPKKGSKCYQISRCGHTFCLRCLQDFYTNAINEGDIAKVRCIDPSCGKGQEHDKKKKKQRSLHPTELLDMALPKSIVQRFVDLKIKKELESDQSTVYCPRNFCQGPARTQKHHIINDIASFPYSDSDSDSIIEQDLSAATENPTFDPNISPKSPIDRLAICSVCDFAFCRICSRSWHGELVRNCEPRNPKDLSEEERASYEYIRKNTTPCPTCSSPVQKTMGCNHMACFQCRTHFCYLCSSWLEPENPYLHFNDKRKECYGRLWELEGGDEGAENEFGAFIGARAFEAAAFVEDFADDLEVERQGEVEQ